MRRRTCEGEHEKENMRKRTQELEDQNRIWEGEQPKEKDNMRKRAWEGEHEKRTWEGEHQM